MPKLVNNLNSFYYPQGLSGLGIDSLDGYPISEPPAPTLGTISALASRVDAGTHWWAVVWRTEYGMSLAGAPGPSAGQVLAASSTVVVNQPTLPPAGALGWWLVRTKAANSAGSPGSSANPFFFTSTTVTPIATASITDVTTDAALSTRQPPAIANGFINDPGLKTNPTLMPDRQLKIAGSLANTPGGAGYLANQPVDSIVLATSPASGAVNTVNIINSLITPNSWLFGQVVAATVTANAIVSGDFGNQQSGFVQYFWKNVGTAAGVGVYTLHILIINPAF